VNRAATTVYVADSDNKVRVPAEATHIKITSDDAVNIPSGVAVDGAGNVDLTDRSSKLLPG